MEEGESITCGCGERHKVDPNDIAIHVGICECCGHSLVMVFDTFDVYRKDLVN